MTAEVLDLGAPDADGAAARVISCSRRLAAEGLRGDVERGRELVWDLLVYLVHGRNLARAARELYLHRNTLLGRVRLLEGLMGVDLAGLEAADVLRVEVACLQLVGERPQELRRSA